MLYLRTGLPGASKTLNTLKEICEDNNFSGRPIYYNNIKLLMLDFSVCESFQGYFYGAYYPQLSKAKKAVYDKTLLRIHADDELASISVFPHLEQLYDAWLSHGDHVKIWLYWARRCYPSSRLKALEDYLQLTETPAFAELARFNLDWRHFDTPTAWYQLERNSIIVIDECQQWFPPRAPGSRVPAHCSEFETHRHKGFDIHLITQDAKLLDSHVRRLTGRHVHFFNPFTSNRVTRLQADKVFDPDDYHARQKTQSKIIKRDKNFYGLYWSADQHTHKFKIPKKALLLIPIAIILPTLIWLLLSGNLVGSPETSPDPVNATNTRQAPVRDSQASFSSDPPPVEVLPSSALSDVNHPLLNTCERVSYSARITTYGSRSRETAHYLQCENRRSDSASRDRRSSRSDDDDSRPRDEWEVTTLDANFLMRLGYKPRFEDGLFTLTYENYKFIFPSI